MKNKYLKIKNKKKFDRKASFFFLFSAFLINFLSIISLYSPIEKIFFTQNFKLKTKIIFDKQNIL